MNPSNERIIEIKRTNPVGWLVGWWMLEALLALSAVMYWAKGA